MNIKTYIAAAVVALTAACSQEAPAPEVNVTETVAPDADAAATEVAAEPAASAEAEVAK